MNVRGVLELESLVPETDLALIFVEERVAGVQEVFGHSLCG
jgi:hypothetical protein